MNPELRRNLWLEISTHRLIAMPVVLGLVFFVVSSIEPDEAASRLAWLGLAGFTLITALWGMRLAANSVLDELAEKTWDWQRLSFLTPWAMTWGKLFGATAYAWYGGLICLAVYLCYTTWESGTAPVKTAVTLVLSAIALHAGTLVGALMNARRNATSQQSRRSFGIVIFLAWIYGARFLAPKTGAGLSFVTWYGTEYAGPNFLLISVAIFAAWALLGAFRSMSQNLAVGTTPWALLGFLVFLTVYSAGFPVGNPFLEITPLQVVALVGLAWSSIFTYLLLFTEATGPIIIRRVLRKIERGQWKRAVEEIPSWPLTWILLTVCAIVLTIVPLDSAPAFAGSWAFAPLPFALLVARDAAILLFFSASPKPQRAIGATLIYILILDWLIPGLLAVLGFSSASAIVLPLGRNPGGHGVQILVALLQTAVAGAIAYRRLTSAVPSHPHPAP